MEKFGLKKSPSDHADDLRLNNIEFVVSSSLGFIRKSRDQYDLIFLDGDHAAVVVYNEISFALQLIKKNGVILLHDYYPQGKRLRSSRGVIRGPYQAVERIKRENPGFDILPLGSIPETSVYSEQTSLALVGQAAHGH